MRGKLLICFFCKQHKDKQLRKINTLTVDLTKNANKSHKTLIKEDYFICFFLVLAIII